MGNEILTLFSFYIKKDLSIAIEFSGILLIVLIIIFIVIVLLRKFSGSFKRNNFEIDRAEVGVGSGKIILKPNSDDQQIAYKIWVELSTRKIGLPIDLKNDVIPEIYNSWYDFFSVTRELIKDIPVSKVKKQSTQKIINLSIDLLNNGLRPHLTSWQARFRHWYETQIKNATGDIDPQEIQKKYPKFDELQENIITVNKTLMRYREKMYELVLGNTNK